MFVCSLTFPTFDRLSRVCSLDDVMFGGQSCVITYKPFCYDCSSNSPQLGYNEDLILLGIFSPPLSLSLSLTLSVSSHFLITCICFYHSFGLSSSYDNMHVGTRIHTSGCMCTHTYSLSNSHAHTRTHTHTHT